MAGRIGRLDKNHRPACILNGVDSRTLQSSRPGERAGTGLIPNGDHPRRTGLEMQVVRGGRAALGPVVENRELRAQVGQQERRPQWDPWIF